ncbi:transmembrane protein 70 homolog, mitochondrial [Wyeomyia smithii]|uniref:transmembrane protein 70 homolog, mitochondrial n=1 Tax=Wyeomyia smithii TaxID=174621 RepID=UPI002467E33C|nr:transmembrane protein 70 homolog, mitochondrial [Wyeomyia smithii]XP_055537288.1 transmembrane protein 70 homolog, mitochondrial [Wyeomyia smithii]
MICLRISPRGFLHMRTPVAQPKLSILSFFTVRNRQIPAIRCLCSKATDGNDNQVYYGALTPQIRAVKVFSLVTSIGGLVAQPILLEQANKIGGTPMIVAICGIAGFFTFVTPFLLHLITKRYVTDLSYDASAQEYTATTITFLLQRQQTKFRLKDVIVPEVPGMFTTFMVGEKSLFVDPAMFPDPTHYIKIMGYDKPIDFKFDEARQTMQQESKK